MGWVKAYFRVPDSGESSEFVDEVTGFRRAYFKSTVADNPALAGTDYHRQLLDQPEARRQALLHGDWSSPEGQVFSEWNYARHTVANLKCLSSGTPGSAQTMALARPRACCFSLTTKRTTEFSSWTKSISGGSCRRLRAESEVT